MTPLETLRAARDAGANPETVVILGVPVRVVNVAHLLAVLDVVDALTAERDELRATLADRDNECGRPYYEPSAQADMVCHLPRHLTGDEDDPARACLAANRARTP